MSTPEPKDLRQQLEALARKSQAGREREKELKRQFDRALEKLRRLAAA